MFIPDCFSSLVIHISSRGLQQLSGLIAKGGSDAKSAWPVVTLWSHAAEGAFPKSMLKLPEPPHFHIMQHHRQMLCWVLQYQVLMSLQIWSIVTQDKWLNNCLNKLPLMCTVFIHTPPLGRYSVSTCKPVCLLTVAIGCKFSITCTASDWPG